MATSGTVQTDTHNSGYVTASWSISSTNYANNNYSVKITVKYSGKLYTNAGLSGIEVTSGSTTLWDYRVAYPNSSKTVTLSSGATFKITVYAGLSGIEVNNYNSWTLNTIDRKSSPTLSSTNIDLGTSFTLTTNRKATSFTHTIQGGFSTSSLSNLATSVGESTSITLPVSLATNMPTSTSQTYYIRTITYSGSTNVGSVDKTITVNVPDTVVPSLSNIQALDGNGYYSRFGKFLNTISSLQLSATETLGQGSPIATRSGSFNGITKQSTSLPIDFGVLNFDTIPTTQQSATLTITDERGRSASGTVSIPLIAYSLNVPNPTIQRYNPTLNKVDEEGTYCIVSGTYTKTSIKNSSNAEQNYVNRKIYVNDTLVSNQGNTTSSDAVNGSVILGSSSLTFDTTLQYTIRIVYTDTVGTEVSFTKTLSTSSRPMSIKSDGKGIAFGGVCKENGVKIYNTYSPLNIDGNLVVTGGIGVNTITATGNVMAANTSHIGMIIMSTTLNNMEDVIAIYGGTTWIRHEGYFLRGATSDVTPNSASSDGGSDTHNHGGKTGDVKLTAAQSGVGSHHHGTGDSSYKYWTVLTGGASQETIGSISGTGYKIQQVSSNYNYGTRAATNDVSAGASAAHNHTISSTSNVPLYKNVYIWERTA